jgi:TolB protein
VTDVACVTLLAMLLPRPVNALAAAGALSVFVGCGGGAAGVPRGAALGRDAQLFVARTDGGQPAQLTDGGGTHLALSWSPDGRWVAFTSQRSRGGALEIVRDDGSGRRALLQRDRGCPTAVSWSPRGSVIAFAAGDECAVPATIETVAATGSRIRRIAALRASPATDEEAGPVWSPTGDRILYGQSVPGAERALKLVSARSDGEAPRQVTAGPALDTDAQWSPDGRRIAFIRTPERGSPRLLVVGAHGGSPRAVVADLVDLSRAAWSPDGREMAFSGVAVGGDRRYHLYVVDLRGGRPRPVTGEVAATPPAWSPDGNRIAYADNTGRVRVVAPSGDDECTLATLPDAEISALSWSPDGRALAFAAAERPPED